MTIKRFDFSPTLFKENGLFIINIDKIDNIPFIVKERSIVNIPPGELGGNHKHPRWEAFIGIGQGIKNYRFRFVDLLK